MFRIRSVRRVVRVALVAAVFSALLVPLAPPAHAARTTTVLRTDLQTFTHEGTDYRLRLVATRSGADQDISVSLRRAVDPDGTGPLRSQQTYDWTFAGLTRTLRVGADGATATLRTGTQLAPAGVVDYEFAATRDPVVSCKGQLTKVRGRMQGSMTLKSKTGFGEISLADVPATLITIQRADCGGVPAGPQFCPPRGRMLFGMHRSGTMVAGLRRPRADTAKIYAGSFDLLSLDDAEVMGFHSRDIISTVPAKNVRVSDDLRRGVIRGAAGTFVRGKATFGGRGPKQVDSGKCGRDRRYSMTFRDGALTGSLRLDYFVGTDFSLEGRRMPATAGTIAVRRI